MNLLDHSAHSSRRDFLKAAGALCLGTAFFPNDLLAKADDTLWSSYNQLRSLQFYNVNTQEYLDVTYYENGNYRNEALNRINAIMADRRSGDVTMMDRKLIDTLHKIHALSGSSEPMDIICGYRSPKTNAKMHRTISGVAKHSYHTLGQAVDINIKDIPLSKLRKIALSLEAGGVGYYPKSGFIHVDIGPVRQWQG